MTRLHDLAEMGQSIWYDNIRRALLDSGELQALLDLGVIGVTSNPSIFEKAIAGSTDYDHDMHHLVDDGKSIDEIYEALVLEDIGRTADLLRPIYDKTDGVDGYISLEVSPTLAHETDKTIAEARRLFGELGKPNVMIKVPATPAGIPAIETLIGEGININVTLIFSLPQYEGVAQAYRAGLKKFLADGGDISKVASVASFFISRVDGAVDKALEEAGNSDLQGKIAVANAKAAYARYKEIFSGSDWDELASKGARVQRQLWASTSTKNPDYPDTLYIDALIGPDTVNTVPPATLQAYIEHGEVAATLEAQVDESLAELKQLSELGIDLDVVTQKLQDDGVGSFAKSFESLMGSIENKRERLLAGWQHQTANLGEHQTALDDALSEMAEQQILNRIWSRDHTVWKDDPTEISNRLGWLSSPEMMSDGVHRLQALADAAREAGYTQALLLGMGGSSLAPEMFRKTFGVADGYLDLAVLDSTDPGAVMAHTERLDMAKTLFIVATKSGGTVETLSFFKHFYNQVSAAVGEDKAGEHFVAITDPGSKLDEIAEQYKFRATFLNDPDIGGRYSALSHFGLVPAALLGVDVDDLLEHALTAIASCDFPVAPADNPAAVLGAAIGELAKVGRDKITLVTSPQFASFGDWVEQLIAESTGKEGKGILPVVGEPLGSPDVYGDDRFFVHMRLHGDASLDKSVEALEEAGHPVIRIHLHDNFDIGGQFFIWELATVIAGYRMAINPFDQPNVEAAKILARKMVDEYHEKGALPTDDPALTDNDIEVFSKEDVVGSASGAGDALKAIIDNAQDGAYVALQAYVKPDEDSDIALAALRLKLRDQFKLATTLAYGPRFLHSTGQLHKGDSGKGIFVQFTANDASDVPIPDEIGSQNSAMTFGVLKASQVMGDGQALIDGGRVVVRFHLGDDVTGGLKRLADGLA